MPIQVGPRVPSAADMATKMVERAGQSGDAWLKGMNSPKKDPVKAAIAAKGKWKDSVTKAVAEDRFAKGLAQVDSQSIADTANALGSGVFTNGIASRKAKIEKAFGRMQPIMQANVAALDAMPTDTLEQRKAKVLKNMDLQIEMGKKLRGG